MNRREAFQVLAGLAFSTLQLPAAEPGRPLFFTVDEFALLDALTELIIPTDTHSPGAHAAGVAVYIDRTTAEAFDPADKQSWRKGLAQVESESRRRHDTSFLKSTTSQQTALLHDMNQRHDPFFGQLKETTAFAYYSSSIGIHQEMEYKGNCILQEFVGYPAD